VHAIPVAAALRRAFPAARIDWLVSAKHGEILDLVPVIDRALVVNDREGSTGGRSLWQSVLELRRTRYEAVLDLQGLLKSAVLARLSGAPRVVGFASSYARERLARLWYTEVHDPGRGGLYDPRETRHVVEINLGILSRFGIEPAPPEFPIADVDSVVARWTMDHARGRYALLNPGAAWPNKRWPPERFGRVAIELRDRHDLPSMVLWGPGEEPLARTVVEAAGGAALLSPKTTVADLVALARGAAVMVSGDTGPTHIAVAVGTPLVGVFGPTRAVRNGPLWPRDLAVTRDAVCQCHHLRRCKLDRMCLMDIETSEVVAAVERRLSLRQPEPHGV
jgi:lipopolysaccharide heptosyltransferase I